MLKKVGIAAVLLAIGWAGLRFAGVRVGLAGSGLWLAFSGRPDYDALEADRARQRQQRPAAAPETVAPPALSPAEAPPKAATAEAGAAPASSAPVVRPGDEWTDFRGPNRDGRYEGAPIRSDWPSGGLPRLWRQPVGIGYASFVVAEGRAFTIEQRRQQEVVAAYAVDTGRELWTHGWDAAFSETLGGDGPRATPTYHEGRLYALGATGELRCLDARTGALVWRHNIIQENGATNLEWGMAGAPLIVDDKVIVLPGGPKGRAIVVQQAHGPAGLGRARRSAGLRLPDACNARRRPTDYRGRRQAHRRCHGR